MKWLLKKLFADLTRTVLSVLLILWMKVVNGVRHYVTRVHSFLWEVEGTILCHWCAFRCETYFDPTVGDAIWRHMYLEWWWYALHGDRPADTAVGVDASFIDVDFDGERVPEGDGSEQHLDANQKVLVAGWHGASAHLNLFAVWTLHGADVVQALKYSQQDTWDEQKRVLLHFFSGSRRAMGYLKTVVTHTPCQKERKMTDLTVPNFNTGSNGLKRSLVA